MEIMERIFAGASVLLVIGIPLCFALYGYWWYQDQRQLQALARKEEFENSQLSGDWGEHREQLGRIWYRYNADRKTLTFHWEFKPSLNPHQAIQGIYELACYARKTGDTAWSRLAVIWDPTRNLHRADNHDVSVGSEWTYRFWLHFVGPLEKLPRIDPFGITIRIPAGGDGLPEVVREDSARSQEQIDGRDLKTRFREREQGMWPTIGWSVLGCFIVAQLIAAAVFGSGMLCGIFVFALLGVPTWFLLKSLVWDRCHRAIWFRCPHCEMSVQSSEPWRCDSCKYENKDSEHNSFLDRCGNCGTELSALECPHCGQTIMLIGEKTASPRHFARPLNSSRKITMPEESELDKLRKEKALRDAEREAIRSDREKIDAEIERHKKLKEKEQVFNPPPKPEPKPKKTHTEEWLDELLREHVDPIKVWKMFQNSPELAALTEEERKQVLDAAREKLFDRIHWRPHEY